MQEDSDSLVSKGKAALAYRDYPRALDCFERALQMERTPQACSYLAYCLAKVRRNYEEAMNLALEALAAEPQNPLHYLNFGRVLALAGNREQAIKTLRRGLDYGMHLEIMRELESFGVRKPPVFKKLPRDHFLNRYAGFILARLKLR
jgi:tetratricopeptide (TPR) repeat protein